MKKIIIALSAAGILIGGIAFAQTGMMGAWQNGANGAYTMQFMMTPQNYQQMQGYMAQLQQGQLSSQDQTQMWQLMQNRSEAGVPADNDRFGYGMMGWRTSMMSGYGLWVGWITMLLIWILLGLGIIALFKWLVKNK